MNKLEKITRPNILSLVPYSSARNEFKGNADIFLDANENPFGELNRYPDPMQVDLKRALAAELNVSSNNVFIGNGSDEVIDLLFRIFCTPGVDNVITLNPSYGMYSVSAAINDVLIQRIPLDSDYNVQVDKLLNAVNPNTKIIFLCSPNNPTGNIIPLEDIELICSRFNGIVVVDEAYIDFSDSPSAVGLLGKNWNLVVSQTFSKARGLAAARVGYAIGSEELINLMNKVKPPYNVSKLNQKVALEALLNKEKYNQEVELIKTQRRQVKDELAQLPIVNKIFPSEANFILVKFEDGPKVYNWLLEKNIVVRNRDNEIKNTIRITIGSKEENEKLINELKNYCYEKESTIY
ncbi:histidinol-phosphate transaminase [Parvicella tangerina]|uniref:Histidinol-phosphate aminotransferase n=1 Tax=Parvicella tangerina TaxID=2829795 RepID=A0A916JN03_9FLAO|nr:histidinol-phosphate transaminase [Parvicella tangerina]CAG5081340.1 Histidinol-phosphate aminotransferase [Parvicella tangerina]